MSDMDVPGRQLSRSITPLRGSPVAKTDPLHFPLSLKQLQQTVRAALREDGAFDDVTTIATIVTDRRAHATLVAHAAGTIAGVPLAVGAFRLTDPKVAIRVDIDDGGTVARGDIIMRITGLARAILSAERVALNYMQRLSGIATLTARYVDAVRGTGARILDTRKTTPGLRQLEKYAVRAGGGANHRLALSDGVLIKDNHLAAVEGDIALAVRRVREFIADEAPIEVECDTPAQVRAALDAQADVILLDNMTPAELAECVALIDGRAVTEASGRISLETVRAVAQTGVGRISVGALTHSAPALDLGLDFETMA